VFNKNPKGLLADEDQQRGDEGRSGTRTIDGQVRTRRWKWLGHVLRMPSDKNATCKIALMWAPWA